MDFKKFEIKTILNIKGKVAFGVLSDNILRESLQDLNTRLINKEIQIQTVKKTINTKIIDLDGYKSNHDFNTLNVFLVTNLDSSDNIKIGDEITVKEQLEFPQ